MWSESPRICGRCCEVEALHRDPSCGKCRESRGSAIVRHTLWRIWIRIWAWRRGCRYDRPALGLPHWMPNEVYVYRVLGAKEVNVATIDLDKVTCFGDLRARLRYHGRKAGLK